LLPMRSSSKQRELNKGQNERIFADY